MSLLDNVRQTLEQAATRAGEAASNAREMGQNLSAQAQFQINIKKLQLERREKHRELGERTYEWYQSGTMIVSGPAPAEVHKILRELDDTSTRLRLEESNLEDAKRQAALRAQNKDDEGATYSVLPETNTTQNTSENTINSMNTNTANSNPMNTTNSTATGTAKSTQKLLAEGGVTMPGTGIITNPTPPVSDPETIPTAVPNVPGSDSPVTSVPSNDTPIPSPAPDGPGAGIGSGTGVGIGTGIGTPSSIPGGTF